jgi:hypothetical protein
MSGFVGADVEALRLLGAQLGSQAEELEGLTKRLTARVESAQWRGPDGDRFRSDWSGRYSAMIRSAAFAIRGASEAAKSNAAQQDSASGANDGIDSLIHSAPTPAPGFTFGDDPGMTPGLHFSPDQPVLGDPGMTPNGIELTPDQIQAITDSLGN